MTSAVEGGNATAFPSSLSPHFHLSSSPFSYFCNPSRPLLDRTCPSQSQRECVFQNLIFIGVDARQSAHAIATSGTPLTTTCWCELVRDLEFPSRAHIRSERESQPEEDNSVSARIARLQQQYAETGIRRSVEAVMVTTVGLTACNRGPARLADPPGVRPTPCSRSASCQCFLQDVSPVIRGLPSPSLLRSMWGRTLILRSPGGYLDRTEDEKEGLIRLLNEQLGLPKENGEGYITRQDQKDWTVSECLGTWWRPHFDTFFVSAIGCTGGSIDVK